MKKLAMGVAAIVVIGAFMSGIVSNSESWLTSVWNFIFGDGDGVVANWLSGN